MRPWLYSALILLAGLTGGCGRREPAEERPAAPAASEAPAPEASTAALTTPRPPASSEDIVSPATLAAAGTAGATQLSTKTSSTVGGAAVAASGAEPAVKTRINPADRNGAEFNPRKDDPDRIALRQSQTAPTNVRPPRLKPPPVRPTE